MKLPTVISLLFSLIVTAVSASAPIVPRPTSIIESEGQFRFTDKTTYSIPAYEGDSVARVFNLLKAELQKGAGTEFVAVSTDGTLALKLNSQLGAETYLLNITPNGITAEASRPAGFFYALQTLRQLLSVDGQSTPATLSCMEIVDSPRFGWRGFMLDEGRHFFGKDEVKKVLDMMAILKMNRFHWHLTEDQGWRIEIKKYPKLTEVGAVRDSKVLGWKTLLPDSISYGGYYTQDDIREIVAYAADRFIEIVPEIDIPGHAQAAVAAYPELLACDLENHHEVWLYQGISDDVINVANPAAVQMAKDIIDELVTLFPFPYLHLGGDECPTDKWEKNDACKSVLDSIGSTNFRDLQLNFYRQLTDHMASKPDTDRRKLIFWNEVLHGNTSMLPSDITIMAWVGADKAAVDAATRGLNTILSPQIPYYINRKQSPLANEPMSQGRGTETLEAVYNYVPLKNYHPSFTTNISAYKPIFGLNM